MSKRHHLSLAFGLVGFVFVIAVLFISSGVPARVLASARDVDWNRHEMQTLAFAIRDYNEGYNTVEAEGRQLLELLSGEGTVRNPRQVRFYEPRPETAWGAGCAPEVGLVDFWGSKGYIIIMDYDGDGLIADPEHPGSNISASVIIYCAGRDGDYTTWNDNITSWEPIPQSRY